MFNNNLSGEEAKEHIKQLVQEAKIDRLSRQLGDNGNNTARWILATLILLVVAVGLLL